MHQETLNEIVEELNHALPGRYLGKIFQLSAASLAIDFGPRTEGNLFISAEPAEPRMYLIKRSPRQLEKMATPPGPFAQALRSTLGGGRLLSVTVDECDRVARLSFAVTDDLGDSRILILVSQLTGRSANLFLLDESGHIVQALRASRGAVQQSGQQVGDYYQPPSPQVKSISDEPRLTLANSPAPSAEADEYYRRLEADREFDILAANLAAKVRKEITKLKKLKANLKKDLVTHGRPEEHKRLGDLLLANIASAERTGNRARLRDYYVEGLPTIEIELDEKMSLQDAAGEAFSRYSKSKRAVEEIGARLIQLDREMAKVEEKQVTLEKATAERNQAALATLSEPKYAGPSRARKQKESQTIPGMRRYRSSDGYEVIVGRSARDNDQLTFRVARPNDLWLHAGDYPGSHVIVRNSSRKEIPQRTIIEAAQLAAKFSQASKDSKVTIHYTQRKFLTKPKGAAAGLVRMSSFRSITVEPGENMERI